MFAAVSLFVSCDSNSSKVQDAKEKVQDEKKDLKNAEQELARAEADSISKFEEFRKEYLQMISDNEKTMADLKVRIKTEKKEMRAKLEKEVDALEKKNMELKMKLNEYKYDGKSEWQSFKKEFKHDMEELGHAVKDLTVKNTK